ncbi:MAG: hypothetical protein KJ799_16775 [Bacteroidetes bacterium]|nr:hypothetical protein [Bacteroidota bacterium]
MLFSQDENIHSFWGQVGVGMSYVKLSDSDVGFNLLASVSYEIQNNNFSFTYFRSHEWSFFTRPEEYIKSYEVKYGRSIDFSMRGLLFPFPLLLFVKKDFDYSIVGKIGLSYNEGLKRTTLIEGNNYSSKFVSGIGLPIEIEIREEITSYLGMGLSVHTNFNKVKNYSGVNINFYVGYF